MERAWSKVLLRRGVLDGIAGRSLLSLLVCSAASKPRSRGNIKSRWSKHRRHNGLENRDRIKEKKDRGSAYKYGRGGDCYWLVHSNLNSVIAVATVVYTVSW